MAATTRNLQIYVNGASVIDTIGVSALIATVVGRPINPSAPVRIPPGGSITIKQLA
jgi:hypothetical protein